jgi:hypothetical protein
MRSYREEDGEEEVVNVDVDVDSDEETELSKACL